VPKSRIARAAKSWVTYALVAAAAGASWLAFGGSADVGETAAVERRPVAAVIDVTGSVVPVSSADLGFEQGGRVASLSVREGQHVAEGQLLAALDSSALYADLSRARAALAIARAEAGNVAQSVDAVLAAQDTLVENAYRTLLSEGLVFASRDDEEALDPPLVSGRYDGLEGEYKLRVYRSPGGETVFRVFGLESGAETEVPAADRAVAFGAHGLYVTFPGSHAAYRDTSWALEIPNRSSADYSANLAAYESAVRERDRAVQEAREDLDGSSAETSIAAARVAQAEADVARVEADIAARAIRAPFAGLVKSVEVELGEIAAANAAAVVLISDGAFEIEADLPEIDSTRVRAGMRAEVTIDAFGDGQVFGATVAEVDRAESLDGSVPVYRMKVYLDEPPAELRSGMTANVVIEVAARAAALAVPLAAIELSADGDFVTVLRGAARVRLPVSIGLRGDDGFAEVSGALAEGDRVILPVRQ
jgi:RND family efflux transporter MFP subunit